MCRMAKKLDNTDFDQFGLILSEFFPIVISIRIGYTKFMAKMTTLRKKSPRL